MTSDKKTEMYKANWSRQWWQMPLWANMANIVNKNEILEEKNPAFLQNWKDEHKTY